MQENGCRWSPLDPEGIVTEGHHERGQSEQAEGREIRQSILREHLPVWADDIGSRFGAMNNTIDDERPERVSVVRSLSGCAPLAVRTATSRLRSSISLSFFSRVGLAKEFEGAGLEGREPR